MALRERCFNLANEVLNVVNPTTDHSSANGPQSFATPTGLLSVTLMGDLITTLHQLVEFVQQRASIRFTGRYAIPQVFDSGKLQSVRNRRR
jgi:hypothetical protein